MMIHISTKMFTALHHISRHIARPTGAICGLALLSLLTACATDTPPEEHFPTPDYSYLPPLNINVSHVTVVNKSQPSEDDLASQSPAAPASTLELMAHQRLHATGTSGEAQFVITRADMTKAPHHSLFGSYTIQLTLNDQTKGHHGRITAHVQRTIEAPSSLGLTHNLHTLNTQLMDDMNVELEYQTRRHLASWLTDATGTPLDATIQSQDLTSSNLSPAGTALPPVAGTAQSTGTTLPAATSAAQNQVHDAVKSGTTQPLLHSPPPGVLTLPQH